MSPQCEISLLSARIANDPDVSNMRPLAFAHGVFCKVSFRSSPTFVLNIPLSFSFQITVCSTPGGVCVNDLDSPAGEGRTICRQNFRTEKLLALDESGPLVNLHTYAE